MSTRVVRGRLDPAAVEAVTTQHGQVPLGVEWVLVAQSLNADGTVRMHLFHSHWMVPDDVDAMITRFAGVVARGSGGAGAAMSERTSTPAPEDIDPMWLSRVLGVLAATLFFQWVIFQGYLPWPVSALLLVSGPIAAIEGYRIARRAGERR